jgi:lysophospholipase L1-like esterase
MLRFLSRNLRTAEVNRVQLAVKEADVIILDIGRNDFWSSIDSGLTVRNIGRIAELLYDFASSPNGCRPAVGVATMLPSSRIGERGFVADITRKLLVQKRLGRIPAYIYFDTIGTELLSPDGLHPSSAGYDAMAIKVLRFIKTTAQTILDLIARESMGTGRESCYKED